MDVATPYTPEEFRAAVLRNDERGLLKKWSDHPFYTLFVREKSGGEIPALMDVGRQKAYASSTEQDEIAAFVDTATVPESDGELFVKAVPLAELARNAVVQGFAIFWVGPGKMIEGTTLHLLADTAVVHDQEGQEIAYRSDPLFFEASVDQPAPYKGAVQRWEKVTLGNNDSAGRTPTLYVYDDGFDWRGNPYLPELPESALPVSSLSASAQAFFRRWETPLLGTQEDAPPPEPPEQDKGTETLVPQEWLAGFGKVRELVDKYLVPPASELFLVVTLYEPTDDSDMDETFWEVDLNVPDRFGSLMPYEGMLVSASSFRANPGLPDEPGKHAVSGAFRERLVRQLSWRMFENGRRLGERFYLDNEQFERSFPFRPDNADLIFQPDYEDPRFPCLARFRCGNHDIPVLLQGQVRGNYACEPLQRINVPESEVPSMMPGRNQLFVDDVMELFDDAGGVLVPKELIDFPEPWYKGARASSWQTTYELRRSAHVDRLVSAYPKAADKTGAGREILNYLVLAVSIVVTLVWMTAQF
ncbi:hypothetical protein ACJO2E_16035 [Marinobacter sp. M1N3S26]|uniref:hypothetical protein n=1 Tax=Marinobacter sp. M1N3S26 TaxID=3382299 RepID=UPI00387B3CA9